MTSLNLVLRPSIKSGCTQGCLTLRLIHKRRVKSIALKGCHLYIGEWDKDKQTIIYPPNNPQRASYLLQVEQRSVYEINKIKSLLRILEKQECYSVDELIKLYRQNKGSIRLISYTASLSRQMEQRGQLRTAKAYRTVVRGFVVFNRNKDIFLEQINNSLIKDFESYLFALGHLPNTISYYMRNLRAIYNKAVAENCIVCHQHEKPFIGVYTGVAKTMKRALSLEEIKKIHALDFSTLLQDGKSGVKEYTRICNLELARQYFYFSFYARGMCFVDMANLKKCNIRGGVLRYVRKKTGRQIEVRITPEMQTIIDYFAPQVKDSAYLFPIIRPERTNSGNIKEIRLQYETALRTQNNRLKHLATLAGISKTLSTHVARHTWATISKHQNIPLQVISECLGHSSEKITQIYLNQLDNSVLDEANDRVALALGRSTLYPIQFSRIHL